MKNYTTVINGLLNKDYQLLVYVKLAYFQNSHAIGPSKLVMISRSYCFNKSESETETESQLRHCYTTVQF